MIDTSDHHGASWHAEWCDMSLVSKADVQLVARSDTRQAGLDEAGLLITEKTGRRVGVILQSLRLIPSTKNTLIDTDVDCGVMVIYNNSVFIVSLCAEPSIDRLSIFPCCDEMLRLAGAVVLRDYNKIAIISKSKISYESFNGDQIDVMKMSSEGDLVVEVETPSGERKKHQIDMRGALQRDHMRADNSD